MNQTSLDRPASGEIEISVFGPGFGESIVVHAGHDDWIVIDSCIDSRTGRPAALTYLDELKVDPSVAVRLIIATHWHDDHIRGMSEIVATCASARFACPAALTRNEFLEVAAIYANRPLSNDAPGPIEIFQTLRTIKQRGHYPIYATADRVLFRSRRADGDLNCELTALSPTDSEIQRFLTSIVSFLPPVTPATTKRRLPNPRENDLSVAAWLAIGNVQILLGADLEEHGVAGRGWTAVLASTTRPQGVASFFKIPHHGSANGHHDGVWSDMLTKGPMVALTPWTLGSSYLPLESDVSRITALTPHAYSTSRLKPSALQGLPPNVRKTLQEADIVIRQAEPPTGFVRFRIGGALGISRWRITQSKDSLRLS